MSIEDELRQANERAKFFGLPSSLEGIVLERGRRFTPAPLPDGVMRGEPQNCFTNSMAVVLAAPDELEYRYCEGYTWRPGFRGLLVHHAWVTVDGTDVVIDPTFPDPEQHEYFGIDFQTNYAVEVMEEHGITGLTLEYFAKATLKEAEQA